MPEFYHASREGDSCAPTEHVDVDVTPGCSYSGKPKCLGALAPMAKPKALARSHRPMPLISLPILASGHSGVAGENKNIAAPLDEYGPDEEDPNFLSDEWEAYDVNAQPNDVPVGDIQYCPYNTKDRLQRTKLEDGSWCYGVKPLTDDSCE